MYGSSNGDPEEQRLRDAHHQVTVRVFDLNPAACRIFVTLTLALLQAAPVDGRVLTRAFARIGAALNVWRIVKHI